MRDCVFLLADKSMQAAFQGFFSRERFHLKLGCGEFVCDPPKDIVVAAGANDPGLYTYGDKILREYQDTHRYAVVVLDAEWEGSPGKEAIIQDLSAKIVATGWDADRFGVIVIDPELENWIWQKNIHIAESLGFDNLETLTSDARLQAAWPEGQSKPSRPKETLELLLKTNGIPRSAAIYEKIISRVSVKHCQDASFQQLVTLLKTWFVQENAW